ncbi:MAG: thiopeptide-type bacteriocin biosynthesis protein [Chitinophagales bacterium]|nr:thiopeptide-type bacteriocin biosynthesis protein [Chitinophagales bacterium]
MRWYSVHLYPLDNQDVFLTRALKPFLEKHVWPEQGARVFFVRYEDEKGPHIRLRVRGEESWLNDNFIPAFENWYKGLGDHREQAYIPETNRFGGEENLRWAEELFHVSSRVVLERLSADKHTYGDTMFDAIRMHLLTMQHIGFDREQAARYFARLCEQWIGLFFQPIPEEGAAALSAGEISKAVQDYFNQRLAPQAEDMRMALGEFWQRSSRQFFDKDFPEWLRWSKGNELVLPNFQDQLERVLPSLIHLSNNRLGLNNQDETYICYIIANCL